jgi:Uma2 family endonuclease
MAATAILETTDLATPMMGEPRDGVFYEFVDGRWIETPTMSTLASLVAARLNTDLTIHIVQQSPRPGQLVFETLFRIPTPTDPRRKRQPDLAFVSAGRWPLDRPIPLRRDAWDVVPDLAVEIVSPTDRAEDLLGKVHEYFQAGVRLVWVVYPIERCIHVYERWDRIRVVTETGELDGGEVLPGFRRSIDQLFGPVAPDNGAAS